MEAVEGDVGPAERERAPRRRQEQHPSSREPDLQRARRANGDKEQEQGPPGVSVRRGPQDGEAQPEAEEPGELQRGEIALRGEDQGEVPHAVAEQVQVRVQEVPLGFKPPVPLQRLVPLVQQVQEQIPQLQLLLKEPQQESAATWERTVALP